jgi:hypothetical protein
VHVHERDDEARPVGVAADAARGLDVFGGGLGLVEHHHQAEAGDVETHRDHVGGQGHVEVLAIGIGP